MPGDSANQFSSFFRPQLLNHTYLFQYPLKNSNNEIGHTLNTLDRCSGVGIEEATIDYLQKHLSEGRLTSVQLTKSYLSRILQVQRHIK